MTESKGELNSHVLYKIKYKIYNAERENHNTKILAKPDMVKKIKKIIDDQVREGDRL